MQDNSYRYIPASSIHADTQAGHCVCVFGGGRRRREGCVEGRKYKSILIRIKAADSTIQFVTEALRSENHFLTVKCYSGTYTIIARAAWDNMDPFAECFYTT